jgi:small subunit ribosomal protein S1
VPSPADKEEGLPWPNVANRVDGRFQWSDGDNTSTSDPWQAAVALFNADEAIKLAITGYNKGGLLLQWQGLQGFVPASQLIDFPHFHLEIERINALKAWVDRTLTLKIIEVSQETNRLIFSERAALVAADQRDEVFDRIKPGQVVQGEVTNLTDFGAFVDLGGVEGLVHISELSWSRVTHPSHIVAPGQAVSVRVLKVDPHNGRIALSLKRLKADPWQSVDERFQVGQLVTGVVSNVVNFGAFVMIEDELEGLIHISELAEGAFLHPRNVVQRGEEVVARILLVDGNAKRLALSLRDVKTA